MRIILLGAPGSGKGTQAAVIQERVSIPHISTGDIFRSNIKNGTELGKKAKEYMDKGMLVPDELTIDIVKDRLQQDDCKNGFILDGFPRTIPQAEYLDNALKNLGIKLDIALNIHVPDEAIIQRMSGRRVCPKCGATYHTIFNPPAAGNLCTACGSEVVQRDDDREETVVNRLKTYHNQTEPLIEYYTKQDIVVKVEGTEGIEATTREVFKALGVK